MKNTKKSILVIFGAVAIALLMVSSATAVTVKKLNEKEKLSGESTEVYIDSEIYLTTDDLPTLYVTLTHIEGDDVEYIQILQDIIDLLEDKGYVDSNDMQGIIENSEADITAVYGASTIATTSKTDGVASTIPGFLRPGFLPRFGFLMQYSSGVGNEYGWHLTIKGDSVGKGSGLAVGFFGFLQCSFDGKLRHWFTINGFCLLSFHSGSSGNQQVDIHQNSNPLEHLTSPSFR